MEELVKDADRLVSCLANKVARTFDFSLTGASSRSCKYVLNTLMQTFQNKRLAHAVKENTLDSLVTELLLWLLDDRVPHMDDGSQLLKALNVLMLKILDNADRTSFFVVLINLLRPLDPSRWPSPASNESFASRNQKFSDLVVKCLIKLTKVQISTPPGFSFPSRLPPPGFSSHERMGQAFDTTSGTSLLGPFLLRGSYQTPLNGNIGGAGDIEFMDPAILAVGKGRLQGALNSSMLDMRSNYNSQLNYIENEARL